MLIVGADHPRIAEVRVLGGNLSPDFSAILSSRAWTAFLAASTAARRSSRPSADWRWPSRALSATYVAEGLAGLGHFEEAHAKLELAIARADHSGEAWCRAELMRMKGEFLLRQSGRSLATEAEDCFRAASEIAREQGALFWELRIALSLARLRVTQGRRHEVRQLLAPVYDRFTEGSVRRICALQRRCSISWAERPRRHR